MPLPIGILDQSPIVHGATPGDAIAATIALARFADERGFSRYWLAEHHSLPSLADASPEVLLARLTGETKRIRLGTGGIMLPHYSSFKVAETFRMLEALAPGRIDLGVGRAPGGTRLVSAALESGDSRQFPAQIRETMAYMDGGLAEGPFASLTAMPSGASSPRLWVLGSSDYGAILAAEFGLPYAYAHFIGGEDPAPARAYRAHFKPSPTLAQPHLIVCTAALVAETVDEAEQLVLPSLLQRLRRLRGISAPFPTVEEAQAYPWTERERYEVKQTRRTFVGTPASVRIELEELAATYGADEVLVLTLAPDYAVRRRSYELLADAFELEPSGAPARPLEQPVHAG